MNHTPSTQPENTPVYQRVKTPMINHSGTDRENDIERQKQCDEYEQKTKGHSEFGVQTLRKMGPIEQIIPSNNPEDWGIKKEWILETHRAGEGHYTRIYTDPTTNKKMLLWQGDEQWGLVVEYDSDEHWQLCDRYTFFRWTSELPPRYDDQTHPHYSRSQQTRNNISNQIFSMLEAMEPDFMKEFQRKSI